MFHASTRVLFASFCAGALLTAASVATVQAQEKKPPYAGQVVPFGTGITGGSFFALGTAVAQHLDNELEARFVPQPTEGSVHAIRLLASGEFKFALTSPDAVSFMKAGERQFKGTDFAPQLRTFMPGPETGLSFVVRADSDIKTFDDLQGKRITTGGTIVHQLMAALWEGVGFPKYNGAIASYSEMAPALADGQIDVGVFPTFPRQSSMIDLTSSTKVRFIPISEKGAEFLRQKHPYWAPVEVPAKTYEGQDAAVSGPGLYVTSLVRADADEQLVYDAAKAIVEKSDKLRAMNPGAAAMTLAQLKKFQGIGIVYLPIHPGLQKYIDEKK